MRIDGLVVGNFDQILFAERLDLGAGNDKFDRRASNADHIARRHHGVADDLAIQFRAVGAVQVAQAKDVAGFLDNAM